MVSMSVGGLLLPDAILELVGWSIADPNHPSSFALEFVAGALVLVCVPVDPPHAYA